MATNFPTSLDSFTNPAATDNLATVNHASQHDNINDAVAALEAKVGVNSSAVTTSLDYKISHLAVPVNSEWLSSAGVILVPPRFMVNTAANFAGAAGSVAAYGFVAGGSFTSGHVNFFTTASSTTTSGFLGLYTLDASGNATQVAVTGNITTQLNNSAGKQTVAWSSSVNVVAGQAYALCALAVGASPNLAGVTVGSTGGSAYQASIVQPFLTYRYATGQTTLSASYTFAGGSATTSAMAYFELTA